MFINRKRKRKDIFENENLEDLPRSKRRKLNIEDDNKKFNNLDIFDDGDGVDESVAIVVGG